MLYHNRLACVCCMIFPYCAVVHRYKYTPRMRKLYWNEYMHDCVCGCVCMCMCVCWSTVNHSCHEHTFSLCWPPFTIYARFTTLMSLLLAGTNLVIFKIHDLANNYFSNFIISSTYQVLSGFPTVSIKNSDLKVFSYWEHDKFFRILNNIVNYGRSVK